MVDRKKTPNRASYSHTQQDLRRQNPLHEKAASITSNFEMNRDKYRARQLQDQGTTEAQRRREAEDRNTRRHSLMVKRQAARPVLRPSPTLSRGSDRAAFNSQWSQEQARARRNTIKRALSARTHLVRARNTLDQAYQQRKSVQANGFNTAAKDTRRELFKIKRRAENTTQQALNKTKEFNLDRKGR